jgi:hypothetical protein
MITKLRTRSVCLCVDFLERGREESSSAGGVVSSRQPALAIGLQGSREFAGRDFFHSLREVPLGEIVGLDED